MSCQRLAAASTRPQGSADTPRHASPQQAANIRRHVLAAITVLDLLQDRRLTLAALTQTDLDRWASDGRFTYPKETGHFIRWALARGHACGLTFSEPRWEGPRGPHDTEKRWEDARRLLHDGTLPLPDRVAGLLLLLYAQSAAGIASLTAGHIRDDGTSVTIVLGTAPSPSPNPWPDWSVSWSPPGPDTPPSDAPAVSRGCSPADVPAIPSTAGALETG